MSVVWRTWQLATTIAVAKVCMYLQSHTAAILSWITAVNVLWDGSHALLYVTADGKAPIRLCSPACPAVWVAMHSAAV